MKKSKNKSFSAYIKKLNEIDVNSIISSVQNINLKDLKKIDINELFINIKKSSIFKPAIGLLSASVLFGILLIPSFEQLISSYNKAKKYQAQSHKIKITREKLKKLDTKIKESTLVMSEINDSIINKSDIIFISKLINETAIKTDVEIISILPIDSAMSAKLCGKTNKKRNVKRTSRKKTKRNINNKGSFQTNYFEINLNSNYLNVIDFLKTIQFYDVIILPNCLEVKILDRSRNSNAKNNKVSITSKIISISDSGSPTRSPDSNDQLDLENPLRKVQTRLVLKIPSHSK